LTDAVKRWFVVVMWGVAGLVITLDQITKIMIQKYIVEGELVSIIPNFFNLTLTYNKGIAFGIFAGLPEMWRHFLINGATVVALGMIVYFLKRHYKDDKLAYLAMALIAGGAVGNIIDRIYYGQVVDFIDVYYDTLHWPAFNVADSAVCIGVFILLFRPVKKKVKDESESRVLESIEF